MRVPKPAHRRSPVDSAAVLALDPRLRAVLLGVLAFPWFVHAAVVALSLVARPLAGRGVPIAGCSSRARSWPCWLVPPRAITRPASWRRPTSCRGRRRWAAARVVGWRRGIRSRVRDRVDLLPVIAYDALAYRLPVIAQWLDAGRVAWVSSDDAVRNGYPLGQEAVSAVFVAATGVDALGEHHQLRVRRGRRGCALGSCEACGVRRALARSAAALFVLAPMTIAQRAERLRRRRVRGRDRGVVCTSVLWLVAAPPDAWLAAATGMSGAHVLALKGTGIAFAVCVAACMSACWPCAGFVHAPRARRSCRRARALARDHEAVRLPGCFGSRATSCSPAIRCGRSKSSSGSGAVAGVASMAEVLTSRQHAAAARASAAPLGSAHVWLQMNGPAMDFDYRLAGLGSLGCSSPAGAAVPACGLLRGSARAARASSARFALVLVMTRAASRCNRWLVAALHAVAVGCGRPGAGAAGRGAGARGTRRG